jgi:hypothetical protein
MAYSNIAESLLEMHYFRVLAECYSRVLGQGIHVFKPATTVEQWYGFDQVYFAADLPRHEVIEDLRAFIQANSTPRFTRFRAFMLQFKVVEIVRKASKHTPPDWTTPYLRSELDLEPNKKTVISQHEALRRLSNLQGASVAYVCPMIFEEDDVLEEPELTDLRFVDVVTSPNGWLTNERHFIAFQNDSSQPTWCSQPVPGKPLDIKQIIERAKPLDSRELFELLARIRTALVHEREAKSGPDLFPFDEPSILPACLSIVAETRWE